MTKLSANRELMSSALDLVKALFPDCGILVLVARDKGNETELLSGANLTIESQRTVLSIAQENLSPPPANTTVQ